MTPVLVATPSSLPIGSDCSSEVDLAGEVEEVEEEDETRPVG
jgi:hypothetical protein